MKTEDSDVQYAQGLLQSHHRRQAMIDPALRLFEEASRPEERAATARYLIGVTEQADVEFVAHMARVADRISGERRALAAVAGELFGKVPGGKS